LDDDEALDRQRVPDSSALYVSAPSLCSYHRHCRSRTGSGNETGSGNDAIWRTTPPVYVADAAGNNTSFPLLVHPASTLAPPFYRSAAAMTSSPEVARRREKSFRSADNLDCAIEKKRSESTTGRVCETGDL